MLHPIYQIHSFQIVAPYILQIKFDDGIAKIINFKPWLTGELYSPLCELSLFNQVQLDPEIHTLVWPNGADFDPATLHDWPALNHHPNLEIAGLHGENDPWDKLRITTGLEALAALPLS